MGRAWLALVLAACSGAAGVDEIDAPPLADAELIRLCDEVGRSFCVGESGCRITHDQGRCEERWHFLRCAQPEPLDEDTAHECAQAWTDAAQDCPAWWSADYWVTTAPACATMIAHSPAP